MERLSDERKNELAVYWSKYKHQVEQQYGYDLIKEGLGLRYRCQTDGFFLAREILGYRYFSKCHEELFSTPEREGFFLLKDPSKSFKDFAEADKGLHDRLLFLPRGGFKSTADIVDSIQIFITWPSIRISIMTGTVSLAEEFTGIIKGHFALDPIDDPKEKKAWSGPFEPGTPKSFDVDHEFSGKLKLIQILFPEHCMPKPGEQPEWTTPARKSQEIAGPTIRAISLGKNSTGTHCDFLKVDDGTNSENTQNKDRITSVNREIAMARKLCEPYGYKDRIGTPYAASDNLTATVKDEETRFRNGQPAMVKVLSHPAGIVKPGFEDLTIDLLQDHMIDLWFPERITLPILKTEYAEANKTGDTATFYSQFFLDLNKSFETKFRRELMVARTVDTCPQAGMTFEAWDLAYSEQKGAKYTVGIAGLFTMQGIYIVDMVRGRFSEYELPAVMANFAHKWKPRRVAVEDSMGARWLNAEIRREQERLRIHVPFEFVNLGKGSKANSKEVKAKPAVRLLGDGRLYFWKAMSGPRRTLQRA